MTKLAFELRGYQLACNSMIVAVGTVIAVALQNLHLVYIIVIVALQASS